MDYGYEGLIAKVLDLMNEIVFQIPTAILQFLKQHIYALDLAIAGEKSPNLGRYNLWKSKKPGK